MKLGGRVDALVFTGGIGENDSALRAAVCEGLTSLGISLDPYRNTSCRHLRSESHVAKLHEPFSRTKILVVPADEELR